MLKKGHLSKIKCLITIILLTDFSCNAQVNRELFKINTYSSYSSGKVPSEIEYSSQDIKYDSLFRQIYSVASGNSNPDIFFYETWYDDIALSVIDGSYRYIFYNRAKFDSLINKTGSIQGVRSIIAHELSHLLNNHPLRYTPSSHIFEKEADYYSGKILRDFQSTLPEAIDAILIYGNEEATETHPSRIVRINEIKKGWISASFKIFKSHLVEFDSMIYESAKLSLNEDPDLEVKLSNSFNNYVSSRLYFANLIDSLEINEKSVQFYSGILDPTEFPILFTTFPAFSAEYHSLSKGISAIYKSPASEELNISKKEKKFRNKIKKAAFSFKPSGLIYGIPFLIKGGVVFNNNLEEMGIVKVDSKEVKSKIVLDGREYLINDLNEIIASFPDGSKSKVGILFK